MKDIKNSSRKCGRRRPLNHISRRAFGFNKIEIALYVLLDSLSDFIRTYSRLLRSSNCGSAVLDLCRSVRSTLKPFRFWRSLTSQRVYNIVICNIFASPTMAKAPQKQAHFLFSTSRQNYCFAIPEICYFLGVRQKYFSLLQSLRKLWVASNCFAQDFAQPLEP